MKRNDYITWDEYFMGVALLSAQRSKDDNTQVGACIVNENNRIISCGYNGMPNGISDDDLPWEREGKSILDIKYTYTCDAELNAILNSCTTDLTNCTIYVTLFPCNECCKAIIQKGIKKVVYLCDKYADTEKIIASKKMFNLAGVTLEQYKPTGRKLILEL